MHRIIVYKAIYFEAFGAFHWVMMPLSESWFVCVIHSIQVTSTWSSGKCVRFGAGRSRVPRPGLTLQIGTVAFLPGARCAEVLQGTQPEHKNKPSEMKTRNNTTSVLALQDHCSYKAPTTNHHIKKKIQNKC